jgi:hypothetical protein
MPYRAARPAGRPIPRRFILTFCIVPFFVDILQPGTAAMPIGDKSPTTNGTNASRATVPFVVGDLSPTKLINDDYQHPT